MPVYEQRPAPPVIDEPLTVTPQLRATLEAVIRRADEAEVQAFSSMNPVILGAAFTGDALKSRLDDMKALRDNGVFMINRLHIMQFESFSLSRDGRRADVRLTEVWSSNFHSITTRQCVSHFHEHQVPQTISLELTNQGWIVYNIQTHGQTPQMAACH